MEWIKCTDRLPTREEVRRNHGYFLVTHVGFKGGLFVNQFGFDWYNTKQWYTTSDPNTKYEVIAWALLPEPCKD